MMGVTSWFRGTRKSSSNGTSGGTTPDSGGIGSQYGKELLTKEEIVLQLLQERAGVTWQSHIVADTDWAESTVSRVLSELEADGAVRRYRIGRRKFVSLPGSEPAALKQESDPSSA